ncbi:MAG TPA: hypothetical protein PLG36_04110 [Trueperaceae bacterium]|nr:hypothetical protein [Trueperaceae bacterium]
MSRHATLNPLLAALVSLALALGTPALAQVSYRLGGSVAAEFGVAIDGSIPVAAADLTLKLDGEVGSGFFPDAAFTAELVSRYDAAADEPFSVRLGRAYATVYLGALDLSLGNQVVAWGSADAVNPVDVVNPRNLSNPLADPADQRLPTPLVRATWHAPEGVTVDLVLVPVFVPSTLPGARWQAIPAAPPALPPGVTVVGVLPPQEAAPAFELGNMQFGGRATLDLELAGGADVSVMAYRGFRHLPTPSADLVPTPTPGMFELQPKLAYDRVTVVGVDFSAVFGDYVVRGESAYTFGDDPGGTDPGIGNDDFAAVLGVETNVSGGPFLTLQGAYQRTAADAGADPEHSFSTVLAASFDPDNRIGLDVAWLHEWTDGSGVIRPSFSYTFADGLTGTAAATVLYGSDGSTYGVWKDNTQLSLGVEFSF